MIQRFAAAAFAVIVCCTGAVRAQQAPFDVNANVALASLVAIADGHLRTMADTLETLAATPQAQSGDWARVRPLLARVRETHVPAVLFFAHADGTYWTLEGGAQKANVSDRPYFARVMTGRTAIGDLVVSRSTGKAVVVVAVPIKASNGNVAGLLGGSIYLDALSARIAQEMDLGRNDLFWAVDTRGVIALHSDQKNIFVQPGKMTAQLRRVTDEMLSHESGTQTYEFRGHTRTVIYRTSPLTGWHYGFGVVR